MSDSRTLAGSHVVSDLTIEQAQQRHNVSRSQIYNMIASGQLHAYRIGRRGIRITRESSDALRAQNLVGSGGPCPEGSHMRGPGAADCPFEHKHIRPQIARTTRKRSV